MLSQAKVKWATKWLSDHGRRICKNKYVYNSAGSSEMMSRFNETSCCGLIELDGWSSNAKDYNDRNKAKFYQYLGEADEALAYATTTPDQTYAEAFLKEAGFKPSARGRSWKTGNIITIWTIALRSPRAKSNPWEETR